MKKALQAWKLDIVYAQLFIVQSLFMKYGEGYESILTRYLLVSTRYDHVAWT
jgi:hypothetical protein